MTRSSRRAAVVLGAVVSLVAAGVGCGAFGSNGPAPADAIDAGGERAVSDATDASDASDASDGDTAAVDGGCRGALACERVIFVTSNTFTGDIGGLAGADAKCNDAALSAGAVPRVRGRHFLAWLSTSGPAPAQRLPKGTLPYVLSDRDGTRVASSFAALLNARGAVLENSIDADETGAAVNGYAWTGTGDNGSATQGFLCGDWQSNDSASTAYRGHTVAVTETWTLETKQPCNLSFHLYCIEE